MWELAPKYDALLVFAEHRYYGQSKPFAGKKIRRHMHYLTTEQVWRLPRRRHLQCLDGASSSCTATALPG